MRRATDPAAAREALVRSEKLAAIGGLAAGVAHEVNNPLSSLLACLWALRRDSLSVEERRSYQEALEHGLKRIGRTVQQLLSFARPSRVNPCSGIPC